MTKQDCDKITKKLIEAGWESDDFQVRENYSGRGMLGKTTFAIVGCPSMAYDAPELNRLARDNMGKSDLVWY